MDAESTHPHTAPPEAKNTAAASADSDLPPENPYKHHIRLLKSMLDTAILSAPTHIDENCISVVCVMTPNDVFNAIVDGSAVDTGCNMRVVVHRNAAALRTELDALLGCVRSQFWCGTHAAENNASEVADLQNPAPCVVVAIPKYEYVCCDDAQQIGLRASTSAINSNVIHVRRVRTILSNIVQCVSTLVVFASEQHRNFMSCLPPEAVAGSLSEVLAQMLTACNNHDAAKIARSLAHAPSHSLKHT